MTLTTTTTATPTAPKMDADVKTWADLSKAVDANDGVALVPMETLRKLEGAQRLGIHVLNSIGNRLGTLGLGHMPESLPNRQDQDAIVYRHGTPASDVIAAARNDHMGPQDVRNTFKALHRLNTASDTKEVVPRKVLDEKLTVAAQAMMDLLGPQGLADMVGGSR